MKQLSQNVSALSNEARNTYVREQITSSFLHMLHTKNIQEISISEICSNANVGRVSFYRNYESKEDVVEKHIRSLIKGWKKSYEKQNKESNAELYSSLFLHLKENADFYLLLKKQNLMHLFLPILVELSGANPEDNNMWAYTKAFIAYGTYGWIDEWISRGMQESAESMASMLSSYGMK